MSLTSEIIEEYHKTKDVKILLDELNRLTEQSKRHGREEYEMRDKLYTAKKLLFEMKELVDVSISWKKMRMKCPTETKIVQEELLVNTIIWHYIMQLKDI